MANKKYFECECKFDEHDFEYELECPCGEDSLVFRPMAEKQKCIQCGKTFVFNIETCKAKMISQHRGIAKSDGGKA